MTQNVKLQVGVEKETIHSGHFMVSHFEAEAQDDFDDVAVAVPDEEPSGSAPKVTVTAAVAVPNRPSFRASIETSLTKLFRCMTLAYRQKLTSPKWNRFKGIKLRWKEKIRLNNVIWRCWHMQFIKKQNTLVCQFASPLDVDTHVKPETTILEGKYWKRRAEAVIAEYKKWRMFHFTRLLGKGDDPAIQDTTSDMDMVESFSQCSDLPMLMDEDYLHLMSDTLFTTITSHQPFPFPDPREIAKGANLADFIQPSLGPLQPNLDDFMDTLEPFPDLLSMPRLPPVPEESVPMASDESMYRNQMTLASYNSSNYLVGNQNTPTNSLPNNQMVLQGSSTNQVLNMSQAVKHEQTQIYPNRRLYSQSEMMTQDLSNAYPSASYEHNTPQNDVQVPTNLYTGKPTRIQYSAPQKIMPQTDASYAKYNSALPPSQTAPETVSLLQQPLPNPKFTSTIIMQGRNYNREKSRPRLAQYSSQLPNNHYQGFNQTIQPMQTSPQVTYEPRPVVQRQGSPQMQYLQPSSVDQYKHSSVKAPINNRAFKMPSPPLASTNPQQLSPTSSRLPNIVVQKETYRSSSLPVGSQLNADWTISTQVQEAPRQTARQGREVIEVQRHRSRSTSGTIVEPGVRPRPPLNSVASDPALPQASVLRAQFINAHHSKSLYKLNSSTEDVIAINEATKSPVRRGQPSPINDVMSPHHSASPSSSPPPSPGSPREPRRSTHMHAEQKRRYNIKNGFDTLQGLIPHLNNNPAAKISKAAMLQKGAEYIKQLKAERNQIKEEMESLKQQIECLNNSISNCHSLLPATGAPVSRARAGRLREMFMRHVANRSMHNWKYWLFSVVAGALVESFSACVSCGSGADLVRTTLLWAEQHCSLVEMRPAVLSSLRVLCTSTDILTNPERLPDEARAAASSSSAVKTEPS